MSEDEDITTTVAPGITGIGKSRIGYIGAAIMDMGSITAARYPIVLRDRISEASLTALKKDGYDIVILDDFSTPMPEGIRAILEKEKANPPSLTMPTMKELSDAMAKELTIHERTYMPCEYKNRKGRRETARMDRKKSKSTGKIKPLRS